MKIETMLLLVNPFKLFWLGVMLFSLIGILYHINITNAFEFERRVMNYKRVIKRITGQRKRYELIRVNELTPANDFERAIINMTESQFDWLIYKLLYQHEATRRMAKTYAIQVNNRLLDRGYVRHNDNIPLNVTNSTTLADEVEILSNDNQRVKAPTEKIGEKHKYIELSPKLSRKGYRARIR